MPRPGPSLVLVVSLAACAGQEVRVVGVLPAPDPYHVEGEPPATTGPVGTWTEVAAPLVPGWDDRDHEEQVERVVGPVWVRRDAAGAPRLAGAPDRAAAARAFLADRQAFAGQQVVVEGLRLPFAGADLLELVEAWPVVGGRALVVPLARLRALIDAPQVRGHVRRRFDVFRAWGEDGRETASEVRSLRGEGLESTTGRTGATPYLLPGGAALLLWRHEVTPARAAALELAGGARVEGELRLVAHGRAVLRPDEALLVALPHPYMVGWAQLVVWRWQPEPPPDPDRPPVTGRGSSR